ncbi:hypothetical protein HNP84_005682 [Thermocatellispora tengchongensis]|uniref:Uncharacterized protein n=1 Tax=Thermocatellispora tengchongensis TaxID=1073253 RepID=A0A840P8E1_9ACTN|nr:hypothetical protein [Thermocatellispora tengchongensis]
MRTHPQEEPRQAKHSGRAHSARARPRFEGSAPQHPVMFLAVGVMGLNLLNAFNRRPSIGQSTPMGLVAPPPPTTRPALTSGVNRRPVPAVRCRVRAGHPQVPSAHGPAPPRPVLGLRSPRSQAPRSLPHAGSRARRRRRPLTPRAFRRDRCARGALLRCERGRATPRTGRNGRPTVRGAAEDTRQGARGRWWLGMGPAKRSAATALTRSGPNAAAHAADTAHRPTGAAHATPAPHPAQRTLRPLHGPHPTRCPHQGAAPRTPWRLRQDVTETAHSPPPRSPRRRTPPSDAAAHATDTAHSPTPHPPRCRARTPGPCRVGASPPPTGPRESARATGDLP